MINKYQLQNYKSEKKLTIADAQKKIFEIYGKKIKDNSQIYEELLMESCITNCLDLSKLIPVALNKIGCQVLEINAFWKLWVQTKENKSIEDRIQICQQALQHVPGSVEMSILLESLEEQQQSEENFIKNLEVQEQNESDKKLQQMQQKKMSIEENNNEDQNFQDNENNNSKNIIIYQQSDLKNSSSNNSQQEIIQQQKQNQLKINEHNVQNLEQMQEKIVYNQNLDQSLEQQIDLIKENENVEGLKQDLNNCHQQDLGFIQNSLTNIEIEEQQLQIQQKIDQQQEINEQILINQNSQDQQQQTIQNENQQQIINNPICSQLQNQTLDLQNFNDSQIIVQDMSNLTNLNMSGLINTQDQQNVKNPKKSGSIYKFQYIQTPKSQKKNIQNSQKCLTMKRVSARIQSKSAIKYKTSDYQMTLDDLENDTNQDENIIFIPNNRIDMSCIEGDTEIKLLLQGNQKNSSQSQESNGQSQQSQQNSQICENQQNNNNQHFQNEYQMQNQINEDQKSQNQEEINQKVQNQINIEQNKKQQQQEKSDIQNINNQKNNNMQLE